MTRTRSHVDWLYVVAVAVCAAVFAFQTLSLAVGPRGDGVSWQRRESAGEPRSLEVERLRRLIRQGYLSDREALFTSPASAPPPRKEEADR